MAEIKSDPPTPRTAAVIAGRDRRPASRRRGVRLEGWVAATLGAPTLATATLLWLGVTNGSLGFFNLLPGAPLNGGRLLQAALWSRYRDSYRATVVATRVGRQLGIDLVTVGLLEAMMRAVLPNLTVGELMRPLPAPAPTWWTVAHLQEMRQLSELIHEVLPVVDFDGRGLGVISWQDVAARGTPQHDEATLLGSLCRRLPVLAAGSSALDAMRSGALAHGAALVQDADGGFGLITTADLQHAAALGAAHPAQR